MGRPRLWDSPKELQKSVDEYFGYCKENYRPPTIAGLAYYCNVDRQTIYNYSYKDEFFDIIKNARARIVMNLEEEAIINGKTGTIFVMKQYGYKDKQEIETNINNAKLTEQFERFLDKL